MSYQSKIRYVSITIILIFSIVISGTFNNSGFALTDSERYNSGYNWGCSDARKGGHPYLDSHPSHTAIFMNGYKDGYASCSTGKAQTPSTASSVNRNNMFNDLNMCQAIQKYLTKSCSEYVNSDSILTKEGSRAKVCITNGIMLSGLGLSVHLPALTITGALKNLSVAT